MTIPVGGPLELPGGAILTGGAAAPEGAVVGNIGDHYMQFGARPWTKDSGNGTAVGWRAHVLSADLAFGNGFPLIGGLLGSHTVLTSGATVYTSVSLNVARFMPIHVERPMGANMLSVAVSVVHAGTQPTMTMGLWASTPDGSAPNLAAGPLAIGTYTTDVTGRRDVTFAQIILPPGRYWLGHHMTYTTAPTTFPSIISPSNALFMPLTSVNYVTFTSARYIGVGGSTIPTTASPAWVTISDTQTPCIYLRRSA